VVYRLYFSFSLFNLVAVALLCILFNIALVKVARDSRIETIGTVYNKTIQILAFAGDIVLVNRITNLLREAIINLSQAAKEMGFNSQSAKKKKTSIWK
jgi:hypothetical protein